ncbi:DUF2877 domain-containing protein [Staphylococcus sp. NAM3COL9]|uniref:DUF2877 domain-containing protein n=1 Tax=Staphylococcus sp. NAM3COL9 TaxID=1667172 RepID=UPI000708BE92|nr:DUF2877 domain-containing protein [Staphylococcus sp. NAM3COL9]KRG10980.1 hypothetical protein ACA31_01330 [Staphylococcus sp. NAM3COL9]
MIFQASTVGEIAQEILEHRQIFYVHSIFKKGFNIVNGDQTIIFIGSDDNGTFPFGITVDHQTRSQLLANITLNQQIKVTANAIFINDECQLVWRNQPLHTSSVESEIDLALLIRNITTYNFSEYDQGDFSYLKMQQIINVLKQDDKAVVESSLRYLIGRGQGLTPSGDDILTGTLFVHFMNPFILDQNLEIIQQLIKEPLTTLVATTFLKSALKGLFSSKILVLQHKPTVYHMNQLLKVGSSSGKDTLYGIFVASTLRSGTYE